MAQLTANQIDLLVWMAESGPGPYLLSQTHDEPDSLIGVGVNASRPINGADLRELVDRELVRSFGNNQYELTNRGQDLCEWVKSPPAEGPEPPGYL